MNTVLWRIATETPGYRATDLSGKGAQGSGGRWNEPGLAVVYASLSPALACLETLVHLNAGGLPLNRILVQIQVPDAVWKKRVTQIPESLPVGWDILPAGLGSIEPGSQWLKSGTSALLVVPSAIVPEENNVLINPAHPDTQKITARSVRRWLYDPRLGSVSPVL